jgi:hypothetical protein
MDVGDALIERHKSPVPAANVNTTVTAPGGIIAAAGLRRYGGEPATEMFYLLRNDTQEGPLEAADLKHMVRSGELSGEELCWTEGWPEWRPLSSVAGLIPVVTGSPAPATAPGGPPRKAPHPPAPSGFDDRFAGGTPHPFHRDRRGTVIALLCVLLVAALAGNAVTGFMLWRAAKEEGRIDTKKEQQLAALEETVRQASRLSEPLEAGTVGAWITYQDNRSDATIPATRVNVLLYRLDDVEAALRSVVDTGEAAATLIERFTSSLPPPFRENITDSNGFVTFDDLDDGSYLLVALARRVEGGGATDYMWVAEARVSQNPSLRIVLSERNATKPGNPEVEVVGRRAL